MNTCQSSCKVTSILSPIFSRCTYIIAELYIHKTRWKKSHSNFKLTTFRNPWTVSNSPLLVINYRPVKQKRICFPNSQGYVETAFHEFWRQQEHGFEDSVTTLYPSIFSLKKKKKKPKFLYSGLHLRKSLSGSSHLSPAAGHSFPDWGSHEQSCHNTPSSPIFGQLPCFSAGLQTWGWLSSQQGMRGFCFVFFLF